MRDRYVFMGQSVKVSNVFNTLALRQIFWKTNTFFRKLEHRFLVKTMKIENTSFSSKTALAEANVKTNRRRLQNGPITKSGVLPVSTLFFRTFFPVLEPLNDKWTKKMLNIKHFWGHFSIKHCPLPKK